MAGSIKPAEQRLKRRRQLRGRKLLGLERAWDQSRDGPRGLVGAELVGSDRDPAAEKFLTALDREHGKDEEVGGRRLLEGLLDRDRAREDSRAEPGKVPGVEE